MRILFVAYDNGSFINVFPLGLAYLAAILRKNGFDVEIYNQDKHHYPDEHLEDFLNKNRFDIIGIGVIAGYYQYKKLLAISRAISRSKNRPFFVLGGHGPAADPAYFLEKTQADAVVVGEGEITMLELARGLPPEDIDGLAYRDGSAVMINKRRALIDNVNSIPFPAWDLFPIEYYKLIRYPAHVRVNDFALPVISGRGCPFKCTFCYRMDEGFRPRDCENIIEEISVLKELYGITYIAFWDELLMSSVERTEKLCKGFIKAKLGIRWMCCGRLNYAKPGLLRLMKKAGCVFINYGVESMDGNVLRMMRKGLTIRMIKSGVEATLKADISPGLNILFGNIGDNRQTLKKGVEFLLKYDDGAQLRTIRPVTPYPGSALYHEAIKRGLLDNCEDFYERKHVNSDLLTVNFTDLTDGEFHKCLAEANYKLIRNYYKKRLSFSLEQGRRLYFEKDPTFRGFRQH